MVDKPVKITLDAMGGDFAPREIVEGAVRAASDDDGIEIILVGAESLIRSELAKYDVSGLPLSIVNASQAIRDGEPPVAALRHKPDASILVAMRLVKEGQADAMISMGSTGAVMVSAIQILGKLEGVQRPTVGTSLQDLAPDTVMFDMGANSDCKPRDLFNFAIIGHAFARKIIGIEQPTVALLSNGAEEGKGNKVTKEAYQLFQKGNFNFIGNVEGGDIPKGKANVIICDGFVGNIITKLCEGLGDVLGERLQISLEGQLAPEQISKITGELFNLTHVADVGGGGLISGVDGVVWIGHGRSKAPQLAEAIRQARLAVETSFVQELKSELRTG